MMIQIKPSNNKIYDSYKSLNKFVGWKSHWNQKQLFSVFWLTIQLAIAIITQMYKLKVV